MGFGLGDEGDGGELGGGSHGVLRLPHPVKRREGGRRRRAGREGFGRRRQVSVVVEGAGGNGEEEELIVLWADAEGPFESPRKELWAGRLLGLSSRSR